MNILCIIWTINILMENNNHYKVINKMILKGNLNSIESDKIGNNQPEPINNQVQKSQPISFTSGMLKKICLVRSNCTLRILNKDT